VSDSLPLAERSAARDFTAGLGVRHEWPATHEMDRPGYRANAGDRCYFCKAELVDVLGPVAERLGCAVIATGTNVDDARAGFRPGIRAAAERGAVTPLLDAGLTKDDVRRASREWSLPTWDKPAAACLSSRIAYGIEVTPQRLARVEAAEVSVRSNLARVGLASRDLRVRDIGDIARVELDADVVDAARSHCTELDGDLRRLGFATVTLEPFRSGSMNDLLVDADQYR
jgi:uncharacterized protein